MSAAGKTLAWWAALLLGLLPAGRSFAAEPAGQDAALRAEFLRDARPAIRELLSDTEQRAGLKMTFMALPATDAVVARSGYDPVRNEAQIQLRRGWQDVDVAHELMHTRMDLLEGFSVLAWRRDVAHTAATGHRRDEPMPVPLLPARGDGAHLQPRARGSKLRFNVFKFHNGLARSA